MAYIEEVQGVHYDELIGSTAVPVLTKNGALSGVSAKTVVKKGTLLAIDAESKKFVVVAQAGVSVPVACAILAKEVIQGSGSEDITVTVYTSGVFNREKLVVNGEDTVDAHEEELRDFGIYLTSLK